MVEISDLIRKKGSCIIVSGPSGTGKTTICRIVEKKMPGLLYSVSVTSRHPRAGEKDGEDYFFVDEKRFNDMIENDRLIEWAKVYDKYYGTPREFIEKNIEKCSNIILDIDIQGGLNIKKKLPDSVLIFVLPPSIDELRNRLGKRKKDSQAEIKKRLESVSREIGYVRDYEYIVINSDVEEAVGKIESIIVAAGCRI
ncbi:guanylate kinase [Elusimicrobiota bacterium]